MKLQRILSVITKIGLSLTFLAPIVSYSAAEQHRNRHNLNEPIFAYDDIDVHTVSAGSSPFNKQPIESQIYQPQAIDSNDDGPTFNRPFVKTRREDTILRNPKELKPAENKQPKVEQTISTKPALVTPTFNEPTPIQRPKAKREPDQHWSALDNYYQKLRQSLNPSSQGESGQLQGVNQYPSQIPIYVIPQEVEEPLNPFRSSKQEGRQYPPFDKLIVPIDKLIAPNRQQQPFLLPISSNSPQVSSKPDNDFGFGFSPGISRTHEIGGDSILLNSDILNSNNNNNNNNNNQQGSKSFRLPSPQSSPSYSKYSTPSSSLSSTLLEDGKVKYVEWKKLPELLLMQQQQQRVKHQQETFGSWYDHQRSRELLQEEAFCGPRNYVNFHVVPATGSNQKDNAQQQQQLQQQQNHNYSPMHLSRIQLQIGSTNLNAQQLDIPVTLSAGEYPSHIGVYNGSVKDDNFLCSATWIHEGFALTLASCVNKFPNKAQELQVRAGEWNLNKNLTNPNEKPMITRQVEQIYIFPKYQNGSIEHNLALLRFSKPIEYLEVPYICPACQMQSRTTIKTSSCWTPVRSITKKEYFDADGEGETKEKKVVDMIELPVRLIANDDAECFRQTKVEFFNFQHPNYICSADYRRAEWRSKLNQTDYFGSGIYCNEDGNLSLVSILHPIQANSSSAFGYIDLSYYKPWMRNVISGRNF